MFLRCHTSFYCNRNRSFHQGCALISLIYIGIQVMSLRWQAVCQYYFQRVEQSLNGIYCAKHGVDSK